MNKGSQRLRWLAAVLLLGGIRPVLAYALPQAAADSVPTGAPVVFAGDTLMTLYGTLGAFTPAERAAAAAGRMGRVFRDVGLGDDSIIVVDADNDTELVVGDMIVLTVLNDDIRPAGKSRQAVAVEYADRLRVAFASAAARRSSRTLISSILFAVFLTAIFAILAILITTGVPRLGGMIDRRRATLPSLRVQRFEILSSSGIADVLIAALELLRTGAFLVLTYFYLLLTLSLFPVTAPFSHLLFGYVATPLRTLGRSLIDYVPSLFLIGVILFIARYVLKLIHLLFSAVEQGHIVWSGFAPEWAQPTYRIVRFLVLAFVLVMLFPYLPGAKSDAFKGVSLFLGALLTLGSSSAIGNVVAGTVLTYTRAFQLGDRIEIGETVGDVIEKSLLVTRVRTIKNVAITIPNAQVLSSHITNYSATAKHGGIILHTTVTIGYNASWRQVHALLLAAARATENILEAPAPFVLQTALDDFYVRYQINAYTDRPAIMATTYSTLHQNIQDQFNTAGVEIMSPHYRALRDGNATTVPATAASCGAPSANIPAGS